MKLCATPAVVVVVKPDTTRLAAVFAVTTMPVSLPVKLSAASVAVIDCVPAVFSVPLKVCVPLSSRRW